MRKDKFSVTLQNTKSFALNSRKIVWEIDNFANLPQTAGQALESPEFETTLGVNGEKQKWHFGIYPKGSKSTAQTVNYYYISLFIELTEGDKAEVPKKVAFAIMDANGEEKLKREKTSFQNDFDWFYARFTNRDYLLKEANGLLPNGRLTIVCHFDVFESGGTAVEVRDNIRDMWENKIFTDCTLVSSDEKEFQAHKIVLASHSPVFAAMFQGGMIEAQNSRVKIGDIKGEVIEQMLRFIYTDSAPNLDAMATDLMVASDKYEIKRLKTFCERSLAVSLNIGNVCERFALADLHSADHLKSEATHFIKVHSEEIIETDGWKWLAKEHPRLVVPLSDDGTIKRKRKHVNDDDA